MSAVIYYCASVSSAQRVIKRNVCFSWGLIVVKTFSFLHAGHLCSKFYTLNQNKASSVTHDMSIQFTAIF